jgi:transposase-like protein
MALRERNLGEEKLERRLVLHRYTLQRWVRLFALQVTRAFTVRDRHAVVDLIPKCGRELLLLRAVLCIDLIMV